MRMFELLVEGIEERIALLAKQQGNKILASADKDPTFQRTEETTPEDVLSAISAADPVDGKAMNFLVRAYNQGQFHIGDANEVKEIVDQYFNQDTQRKLKAAQKPVDVMQYKTLDDMKDAINSVADLEVTSGKQKRKESKAGADTLFSGPGIVIKNIQTQEAACEYGKNTEWCTAATQSDNKFNEYKKAGDIYSIILPNSNRKFQVHYEKGEFMDENNRPITKKDIDMLSKFPPYKDFLNFLIKKHYSKYLDIKESKISESRKFSIFRMV